ncbi:hypothetical protein N2152v2_004024 [Parachlorella kessleri]
MQPSKDLQDSLPPSEVLTQVQALLAQGPPPSWGTLSAGESGQPTVPPPALRQPGTLPLQQPQGADVKNADMAVGGEHANNPNLANLGQQLLGELRALAHRGASDAQPLHASLAGDGAVSMEVDTGGPASDVTQPGLGSPANGLVQSSGPGEVDDAVLAAGALRALQGASLPGRTTAAGKGGSKLSPPQLPSSRSGPPLLLSMLRQASGAGAGQPPFQHSNARRRKSAPTKLHWAGEPSPHLGQAGDASSGPGGSPTPPAQVGGRGSGRGRGRSSGRGGRGSLAAASRLKEPSRNESSKGGDAAAANSGLRRQLVAALEIFASARGSRRTFTLAQNGTFVKMLLPREVEECHFLKFPDVYRELLFGSAGEAVFLHRASGKEWRLGVNPLRLKSWEAAFGLRSADELVLLSGIDDPQLKASSRTNTSDGRPVVLMEIRRAGVSLQPSQQPVPTRQTAVGLANENRLEESAAAGHVTAAVRRASSSNLGAAAARYGWSDSDGGEATSDRSGGADGGLQSQSKRPRVVKQHWDDDEGYPHQPASSDMAGPAGPAGNRLGWPPNPAGPSMQQQQQASMQQQAQQQLKVDVSRQHLGQHPAGHVAYREVNDKAVPVALRMCFAPLGRKLVEMRVVTQPTAVDRASLVSCKESQKQDLQQQQHSHGVVGCQVPAQPKSTEAAGPAEAVQAGGAGKPQVQPPDAERRGTSQSYPHVQQQQQQTAEQPPADAKTSTTEVAAAAQPGPAPHVALPPAEHVLVQELHGTLHQAMVDPELYQAFALAFVGRLDDHMRSTVHRGIQEAAAHRDWACVRSWVALALADNTAP